MRSRAISRSPVFNARHGINCARFPEALIRYRVVGKGPQTLVLATDAPIVIEQYDELLKLLETDFRVIVFEIPGFGFSMPRLGFSFEFKRLNNLVTRFLKSLNFGPYILAFPCVAAYGAIDIANRYPDLVSGVVLLQTPVWSEQIKWKYGLDTRGLLSRPIIGQLGLHLLKRKSASQWLASAISQRDRIPHFVDNSGSALAHGACFCLASAFQFYLTDVAPTLEPIRQASLIIWGESDNSHYHTDKASSQLYCPQARDVRFQHAGHFPELEEPEMFSNEIKAWARTING
jgi:pimeloyl-ACP methyl ester carboxylesterase